MSLMSVAVREHLINTAFGLSALNGTDWKSPKKQKVDMSAQTYPGENQGNYVPPLPTVLQIALQPNPQRVWWVFQLTCLPCCIKPHRPPEAQGPTPRSAGSRPPRPHQNTALSNPEISCNAERAARDTWVRFQKYPHTHTHSHTHAHESQSLLMLCRELIISTQGLNVIDCVAFHIFVIHVESDDRNQVEKKQTITHAV